MSLIDQPPIVQPILQIPEHQPVEVTAAAASDPDEARAKKIGQPRGRPPRDHTWDTELSCWVDASGTPRIAKSPPPSQPKPPMVTIDATAVAGVGSGAGSSDGGSAFAVVITDPNAPLKKKRGRPPVR